MFKRCPTDPVAHSITLLGTYPDSEDPNAFTPAIIRVEKTALPAAIAPTLISEALQGVQLMESTNIVSLVQRISV